MKKVWIIGAGGQLGRAITELLEGSQEMIPALFDVQEGFPTLDITKESEVKDLLRKERPSFIFNCAAFTAVDACETQEEKAYALNALGPKYLAEGAKEVGAVLVQVSTDYVFPGTKRTHPYVETDSIDPKSAYGRTKGAGEKFVIETGGAYYLVRTAWLYGQGKNFVRTMLSFGRDRGMVQVVNDQKGSPTSAAELARAILFLTETKAPFGIYHATCEGETTWYDFAKEIFAEAGEEVTVSPLTTEEYQKKFPASSRRPAYSVLENQKLHALGYEMKDWKSALKEYMDGERRKR